jgi:hypothetical protein
MSKYRDQYVSGVPKDQFGPKPEAEPVEEQIPVEDQSEPESVEEQVEPEPVGEQPDPEPTPEPAKPEPKGAELPPVDRPSGMRARAQHHLDAYTAKLRRTPHGGPSIRTCEVVISVCRDILGEEG